MKRIVFDSSSLILLAKITLLEIFTKLFDKNYIPKEVFNESIVKGKEKGMIDVKIMENMIDQKNIDVRRVENMKMVEELCNLFNLDRGEAESIALSEEVNADLLITEDDRARKIAERLKIKFTTCPDIILFLTKRGMITKKKALEALDNLQKFGWYKDWVIQEVIERIGDIK
ncbi:MAG: hypothetical protein ISS48_03375 [Candidatus Aenigmarchaeota archaeon]|nr:hypothetical protein [Candidatus Aenigmarchaeota archaeon]